MIRIKNVLFVTDVLENNSCVRCLSWIDENRLVVGDEAGMLHLLDIRNLETDVKITGFPAPVHKLAVHPE